MADATTAARARIDRALAGLERKILELKARTASTSPVSDDDLFAPRRLQLRHPRAADAVRDVLAESEGETR
jgi:hypothetical protein